MLNKKYIKNNHNTFHPIQVSLYFIKREGGKKEMRNNMRVLLAKRREKVSDVANATGLSKSTLTALYYERTKRPDIETLKKVSDYLGVTVDEFLNVEE